MQLSTINLFSIVGWLGFFLGGFLLGGVPFGYLMGKYIKNVDVRQFGSGSIGATNIWRALGIKYAIFTFLLDGLKSLVPVFLVHRLGTGGGTMAIVMLLMTVSGHIFSPWLGLRGGKGISSFILGLAVLDFRLFLVMILCWSLIFCLSRISGLASLVSTTVTLISSCFIMRSIDSWLMIAIYTLIVWAHRKNIRDLISRATKR
ncbi:MAG: glycerol-3-phosphate acyltransferase [Rickettsiales bacterium]|jgi:glycerol-3-phosphate acyltransferase PlsY|nr:glycerol-3-phosphate acyltransferase [Rickettsiales bacterium]